MEELFKVILSIVGAIIYFWISSRKAAKPPAKEPSTPPDVISKEKEVVPPRKVSLEELLKEFEQQVARKQPVAEPEPDKRPVRRSVMRPGGGEAEPPKSLEVSSAPPKSLERLNVQARSLEVLGNTPPVSFPRLSKAERGGEGQFVEYQPPTGTAHPLAQLLQNPENLRNAVILSEILNRRW